MAIYDGGRICRTRALHYRTAMHCPMASAAMHRKLCIRSVESFLLVGSDGAVRGGVSHASQHKALAHLVIIQERLVGLVNGTSVNFASARRAGTSAARVGKVNTCI